MPIALQSRETQTEENPDSFKFGIVDVTLDTAYPTGGSVNVAALLGYESEQQAVGGGAGQIVSMIQLGPAPSLGVTPVTAVICYYQPSTDKLQCYWTGAVVSTALAEVTNATNLSAFIMRFLVLAR